MSNYYKQINEIELRDFINDKGGNNIAAKPLLSKETKRYESLNSLTYFSMIVFSIGIKCWQPLAITASQQPDGTYAYNKTMMVLLGEIFKFTINTFVFLLIFSTADLSKRASLTNISLKQSVHLLIPAIFYAASNTLVYYGLSYINPGVFHVLGNVRIIIAGILYRVIMKVKLADIQWLSLCLLTSGAVLSTPPSNGENDSSKWSDSLLGSVFITLMVSMSTFASVYTEMYYKRTKDVSIWYQNVILSIYGIIVNAIYLGFTELIGSGEPGIFEGWDFYAFQAVFVQAIMGMSLSFLFKYLDNIVYVISLTVSMLLTAFISMFYFEFKITPPFVCALVVIIASIYLYNRPKIIQNYQIDEKAFNF
ncbi:unnamed protein product [Blepharisma stoltei]|uniref:Uncharacterized protein n=1 Tax=Blepharisma stoltei TaxID=1481888 RepID=A0AAU9JW78_9CILI|nr:unnamed protein product [Blepharisma stoltei]